MIRSIDMTNLSSTLLQEVDADRLMTYDREVAKEVRMSGSAEEERAFAYVKHTLEQFGLETKLFHSDAYISLPLSARLQVNGQEFTCITHSMAVSTAEDGLTAELVDLGKGTSQEYARVDASGKVVLLDGLAVPAAVKQAQEHGAVAAVFINAEYTHEMIVSPVWGSPTPETKSTLPAIPVISVKRADGDEIRKLLALATSESLPTWLFTLVDTGWRPIPTLIAELQGQVEPENFVLFSGHIDSWHYGAMDNGSANATMLEVARILAQYRHQLRRSLRLAFWSGHSHGRYAGSTWYCDTHWEELQEHCVLHVNIDSVGAKGSSLLTEANCMAETRELAVDVIRAVADQEFEGSRFGRAGDQSFWGPGVPSLFMGLSEQPASTEPAAQAFALLFGAGKGGGFGWWWHTTEDTIDKIDAESLVRDCKVYLATVFRACLEPVLTINPVAAVQELSKHLTHYHELVTDKLDLGAAVERIQLLEKELVSLYKWLDQCSLDDESIRQFNAGVMEVTRILVALNYVKGSIFEHDAALKQLPIPVLSEIQDLVKAEPDSDEFHMLRTLLTRRVNRVCYDLKCALQTTQKLMSTLSESSVKKGTESANGIL